MNKKIFLPVILLGLSANYSVFALDDVNSDGVILPPLTPEISKTINSNLHEKPQSKSSTDKPLDKSLDNAIGKSTGKSAVKTTEKSTEKSVEKTSPKTIAKRKKPKIITEPPVSDASSAQSAKKMVSVDGNENVPMTYQKDNITILRKFMKNPVSGDGEVGLLETMPWQVEQNSLHLPVEIHDGMTMYNQKGLMNISGYSDSVGVMMIFPTLGIYPIIPMDMYASVDIFFIDKLGKVISIAPDLVLANLDTEIEPKSPIMAYLFMKGGSRESLSINVGDEVVYSLFKKPPPLIEEPPSPVAPLPELEPKPALEQQEKPVQPIVEQNSSIMPAVVTDKRQPASQTGVLGKTEIPTNPPSVNIIK